MMKNIILLVVVTVCVSFASFGQSASEPSSVKNTASAATQPIEGWQTSGKSDYYDVYLDGTISYTGNASGSIKSILSAGIDNGRNVAHLMQTIKADNYHGKRLRMSAYIKSEAVERAALWMRMDGEEMKVFGLDTMDNRPIKGTADWQKYEIVLDVPIETQQIVFGVNLKGSGQIWIDDVRFEVVAPSVPTTTTKSPTEFEKASAERIKQYKTTNGADYERQLKAFLERNKTAPPVPINLDFEN